MRTSIWDILTGVVLLGTLCVACLFATLLFNPTAGYNPFPPPITYTAIVIPTDTQTPAQLPPTWTPSPLPEELEPLEPEDTAEPEETQPSGSLPGDPTLRPSSTPIPTFTAPVLPTFTPTRRGGAGGIGGGNCTVEFQSPQDNTAFDPGEIIETRWTLKNTSSQTWRRDSVDIRYNSGVGTQLHVGSNIYDLNYDVNPQAMIDIVIPMRAPNPTGTHTSNWALMEGDRTLCRFFVTIRVR